MSAHTPPGPRPTVFVGNLSYDTTEEKVLEVLREVGPVKSFKIHFDRQTNKPKGYGFADYYDVETASSAVRNLNGREFMSRQLKISFPKASENKNFNNNGPPPGSAVGGDAAAPGGGVPMNQTTPSMYGTSIPIDGAADHVVATVAGMPDTFMYDVVRQMKGYMEERPEDARRLLEQNPQVAFALVHMQIKMGLVDEAKAHALLASQSSGVEKRIQQHEQHLPPPSHRPPPPVHNPHQPHQQQHPMQHGGMPQRFGQGPDRGGMGPGGGMHGPAPGNVPFGNHMRPGMGGPMMGGGMPGGGPMPANGNGAPGPPPPGGAVRGPIVGMQPPQGNDQARKMEIYEKVRNMTEEEIRTGPYEAATREKLLKIKYALQKQG